MRRTVRTMMAGMALPDSLRDAVGAQHALVDDDLKTSFETDWTGRFTGSACAVVRPASTDVGVAGVRACAAAGAAIVTQGGNTGLVGVGVPAGGEVLLSVRRLS